MGARCRERPIQAVELRFHEELIELGAAQCGEYRAGRRPLVARLEGEVEEVSMCCVPLK